MHDPVRVLIVAPDAATVARRFETTLERVTDVDRDSIVRETERAAVGGRTDPIAPDSVATETDAAAPDSVATETDAVPMDDVTERSVQLQPVPAERLEDALATLRETQVDAVLSRQTLTDGTGLSLLQTVRERDESLPFVLWPASGSEALAAQAVRHGATDYVTDTDREDEPGVLDRVIFALNTNRSTTLERLPVGAVVWDERLRIVRANATAADILGYDPTALAGSSWQSIVPEADWSAVEDTIRRIRRGNQRSRIITRNLTAGGDVIPCEWNHRAKTDANGDVIGVISTFQDVSDRIEREERVEQLRDQLRQLSFTSTKTETERVAVEAVEEVMGARLSGVHLLNDDGDRIGPGVMTETAMEAFESVPSYDRDAPSGTKDAFIWEIFERGEPCRVDDIAADDRIGGSTPAGSVIVHPLAGHGVFIVSATEAYAFTDTDEALAEILARSLTTALDRVDGEQRRRDRERRLSLLHEATRDLITARTDAAVAKQTLEAAEEILGFSIVLVRLYDEAAGGLVPVAESDAVTEHLPERPVFGPGNGSLNWNAFEHGDIVVYHDIEETDAFDRGTGLRSLMILPLGKYGTVAVGELEPNSFTEADISVAQILATTVETVLEANERKAALRQQRDELEAQNARLERFADVLSHDLRNPLTVAQGRLQLAMEELDSEHLAAIDRAHDRMGTLIDDLLSLARNNAEVTEIEPVNLDQLLARCWETVDTADATLCVETNATIEADPNRLQQVFENLFRNAVEHAGTDVTVTVGDLAEDAGFYVADDGPGIDAADRSNVFEFGYSDSAAGTGFGLSIVASIVNAHGWTVDLVENDGGGARFEFRTDPDDIE